MRPEVKQTWLTAINRQRGRMGLGDPSVPRDLASELPVRTLGDRRDLETGQVEIQKIRIWHEQLVDYMLLNPHAKKEDIARHFGRNVQWIYSLIRTDLFKAYYRKRFEAHQQAVTDSVIARTSSVANKALDKLAEKLDKSPDLPMSEIRQTAEMAIRALGYGAGSQRGPALGVQVNVNQGNGPALPVMSVPTEVVKSAQARMAQQRELNTSNVQNTSGEYMRVTASLEVTPESVTDGVEDAIVVNDGTHSPEASTG